MILEMCLKKGSNLMAYELGFQKFRSKISATGQSQRVSTSNKLPKTFQSKLLPQSDTNFNSINNSYRIRREDNHKSNNQQYYDHYVKRGKSIKVDKLKEWESQSQQYANEFSWNMSSMNPENNMIQYIDRNILTAPKGNNKSRKGTPKGYPRDNLRSINDQDLRANLSRKGKRTY